MVSGPREDDSAPVERARGAGASAPLVGSILLTEDGRDNQILVASILRRRGLGVTIVENGRLAVERALEAWRAGRPFDVILMDMQMPELDGYGATAQRRASGYQGAVVALTAHAMAGERERCLSAGCDDYLAKPIERARLLATVGAHVQRSRSEPLSPCSPSARRSAGLAAAEETAEAAPSAEEPRLISTFADDPEMAERVGEFVAGLPAQEAALRDASVRGDHGALQRLAHQLKGAAGGYGFAPLTEAAARVEDALRSGTTPVERERAVEALLALCARARKADDAPRAPATAPEQSVLAIDDSPHIHRLIEARLQSEKLVLYGALDAAQGIALARAHRPDLVLLDLDLPGVSGLEVCRQLKSDPQTAALPVVFLTSTTDAAIKAAALDLGAVDYVTKPFDAVELRARVRAALRTKRFQDTLAVRAQIDALTGLWNRAFFDDRLGEEVAASVRHGRPLALAMVDVDHFKRLNDAHGHPFGDSVLQRVASTLASAVRTSDVVCRYGGEEFGVIFRETGGRPRCTRRSDCAPRSLPCGSRSRASRCPSPSASGSGPPRTSRAP